MSEQLYQRIMLEHARNPHGAGKVPRGTEDGEALNSACGDDIRIALQWGADGRLEKMTHELQGCAVSKASASLASQKLAGLTAAEIREVAAGFHARLGQTGFEKEWGDFQMFNGIEKFPARIHCARLVWQAVAQALAKREGGAP